MPRRKRLPLVFFLPHITSDWFFFCPAFLQKCALKRGEKYFFLTSVLIFVSRVATCVFLIFELSRLFIKNSPEENHRNGLAVRLVLRHSLHLGVVEERREDLVFGTFVRGASLSSTFFSALLFLFFSFFFIVYKSRRSLSLVLSIVAER